MLEEEEILCITVAKMTLIGPLLEFWRFFQLLMAGSIHLSDLINTIKQLSGSKRDIVTRFLTLFLRE